MRFMFFWAGLWAAIGVSFGAVINEEVSRNPPAVFAEKIAPLLTPVEKVLPGRDAFPDNTTGGVVLLSETIYFRDADGVLYHCQHIVQHATNESAIKTVSTDNYSYDRERESIFLVSASTFLNDGSRRESDAKGTFIQTPQRGEDSSLYTSQAELNIIYPKVAAGSSTESIVVIRENSPLLPGEFMAMKTFEGGWPAYRRRLVVDLPKTEWSRIRENRIPAGVPDAKVDAYSTTRERRTWEIERSPRLSWEEASPEYQFCAPTVWLTSLESWDAVAGWFDRLVSERSDLGAELKAAADEWTKGVTDPAKILAILHQHVAIDVRYTGLEFGLAGFQPAKCQEVWANRYGDCKDKANLLRALLEYKGIRAHVVLLNTGRLGRVQKLSPSCSQFDHAIAAVDDGKGGYIFCDPTAKYLPPGLLPTSDLAREVLVIDGKKAIWVRTPDLLTATIDIKIEATLATDGALSGWFDLEATGSDASLYASDYAEQDKDDLLRRLEKTAEQFIPGIKIMDTDYKRPEGSVTTTRARAYFVRPARAAAGESMRFPYPGDWLPDFSTVGERRFPYATTRRRQTMNVTINVPEGWNAKSFPAAFSAPSDAATFDASWSFEKGKLVAKLSWQPERAELKPNEYAVYRQSVNALKSWVEQSAVLTQGASTAPVAGVATVNLAAFPILPTGAGQLRLLDEKYPSGEKDAERRAGLNKILQWFPEDAETVFETQIRLAQMDSDTLSKKAFADRVGGYLKRYRATIGPTLRGWAEYLEAQARWGDNKAPEALKQMRALADDPAMPVFRRTWSALEASRYLAETDGAAALELLAPFASMESEAQPQIIALVMKLQVEVHGAKALESWLQKFIAAQAGHADSTLAEAIPYFEKISKGFSEGRAASVAEVLLRQLPSADIFPLSQPLVVKYSAASRGTAVRRALVETLRDYLGKRAPEALAKGKDARFATVDALVQQIGKLNDAADGKGTANAIFQLLLYHEPDFPTFAKYTSWLLWWLDHDKREEELQGIVAKQTLAWPVELSEDVGECWSTYASHLGRLKKYEDAAIWFDKVVQNPGSRDFQRVEALGEAAKLLVSQGKIDDALKLFAKLEPLHTTHRKGVDYVLIATLLHLERGEFDRALEYVASLRRQDDKFTSKANFASPIAHLLRAAENPEALRKFWARAKTWRPMWDAVLKEHNLPVSETALPPNDSEYAPINERLTAALNRSNATDYIRDLDTYARLAQWVPLFVNDFAIKVSDANRLSADTWKTLASCVLKMTEGLEPVDPKFDYIGRLWEAAVLGDFGRDRESVDKAKALYQEIGLKTLQGEAAVRVWVSCAKKDSDLTEGLAVLKGLLDGEGKLLSRTDDANSYSTGLLRFPDRVAEHVDFLEKETTRADFPANTAVGKMLKERLTALRQQFAQAGSLSKDIADWKIANGLSWLDEVKPAVRTDPHFASAEGPVDVGFGGRGSGEILKYNALLADDSTLPTDLRGQAFAKLVQYTAYGTGYADKYAQVTISGVKLAALSSEIRARIGVIGASTMLDENQHEAAAKIRKAIPAGGPLAERVTSLIASENAHRMLEAEPAGWGRDAFSELVSRPIDYIRMRAITLVLNKLAISGEGKEAEALLAKTESLAIDAGYNESITSLRYDWARAVRRGKSEAAFVRRLKERLERANAPKTTYSTAVTGLIDLDYTGGLEEHEGVEVAQSRLSALKVSDYSMPGLLNIANESRPLFNTTPKLGTDILELALACEGDDDAKSRRIVSAYSLCDVDIPEARGRCESLLKTSLDAPETSSNPMVREAIARCLAKLALRTSSEPTPNFVFGIPASPGIPDSKRQEIRFLFQVSRGNAAGALSQLNQMNVDELSAPAVIAPALALLKREGRDAEFRILERHATGKLERWVADTWMEPLDASKVLLALRFAGDLKRADLITNAWLDRIRGSWVEGLNRQSVEERVALLKEDWPALKQATDVILEKHSTLYSRYASRALALEKLGDTAGAKEALRVFVAYCLDDSRHPEAVHHLLELEGGISKSSP